MATLRARSRCRVVAGVSAATALAAVAWMLIQGTRGAEITTVLGLLLACLALLVARPVSAGTGDRELGAVARRLARDIHGQEAGVLIRLLADSGDPRTGGFVVRPADADLLARRRRRTPRDAQ